MTKFTIATTLRTLALLALTTFGFAQVQAAHSQPLATQSVKVIQGYSKNLPYYFELDDEAQTIRGNWGSWQYAMGVEEKWGDLTGKTGSIDQALEVNKATGQIYVTTACGYMNLKYSSSPSTMVSGDICRKPVNESFANHDDMTEWLKNAILDEMTSEFPNAAKSPVKTFLSKLISL